MKKIVWALFNILRTLSLLFVLSLLGTYLYYKITEDTRNLSHQITTANEAASPYGTFSILEAPARPTPPSPLVISKGSQHLILRPGEFLYSEHESKSISIHLASGEHLKRLKPIPKDSLYQSLIRHNFSLIVSKNHLINTDAVRLLTSKPAPYGNSQQYFVHMTNGEELKVSQEVHRKLKEKLRAQPQ